MNKNTESYVKIFKEALDESLRRKVLNELEKSAFNKHSYHVSSTNEFRTYDDDFSVTYNFELTKTIETKIWNCIYAYISELNFPWFNSWQGFTEVRYNKYDTGTNMKIHCDHIRTVFDGTKRGVPILSVLGCLNSDYEGGELIFFDDDKLEMNPGDIVIFPSNFLYPHRVTPITKGTRYSFVSWVW